MKKSLLGFLIFAFLFLPWFAPARAQTLAEIVSGRILLDVESHGEAWYVDPETGDRTYLRDGDAAYTALETFGLGITDANLALIPVGIESRFALTDSDSDDLPDAVEVSLGTDPSREDSDGDGFTDSQEIQSVYSPTGTGSMSTDEDLVERLSGYILLQVETNGEAWYVYPEDGKRYYLVTGEAAYEIMRYLSLGITTANLAGVPIASGSLQPPSSDPSTYQSYTLATDEGRFAIKVVTLQRDAFEMVTDTGSTTDCETDCAAKALAEYVQENAAFAGIHGSYFCPPDYAECIAKPYAFDPPAFNTAADVMIHDDTLVFHDRPFIAQTTDGEMHYFHRIDSFGTTLADYEASTGLEVNAAIGNWPSLIEDGISVVANEPVESSFSNIGTRGGIGWDDEYYYLVIASSATVGNLASIFDGLGAHYAMNLDGGGSAALYYDGSYKAGPGRLLPNAILFKEK